MAMERKSMLAERFDTTPRLGVAFGAYLRDEGGTSAIEYALIAAGISVVISTVVVAIGGSLQHNYYEPLADKMSGNN